MANYLIHACPERMWYVDNYLVPSLRNQGINNIIVSCDRLHLGNLESCMKVFGSLEDDGYGTWHLQDDVIICRNFREITERYDYGVVCGFTHSRSANTGFVLPDKMWYSFPCIRISNGIAKECSQWYYSFAKKYAKYYEWVHMGKCDDNFFYEFMNKYCSTLDVLNLVPNLVDHIDYLLGGSMVNQYRNGEQFRSAYFEDVDLVDQLANDIRRNNNGTNASL